MQFSFTAESLKEICTLTEDDCDSSIGSFGDGGSPFQAVKHTDWMQDWLEAGSNSYSSTAGTSRTNDSELQRAASRWRTEHVYLPRCTRLESDMQPLSSGWLAFSSGDQLCKDLKRKHLISRDNVGYMTLLENSSSIVLQQEVTPTTGDVAAENERRRVEFSALDAYAEIQDVSLHQGRCVLVKDQNTHQVICTLMPVSLPRDYFISDGELVSKEDFKSLASDMFRMVDNCYNHVAPTAQHEATLHLLFALDTWIRTPK